MYTSEEAGWEGKNCDGTIEEEKFWNKIYLENEIILGIKLIKLWIYMHLVTSSPHHLPPQFPPVIMLLPKKCEENHKTSELEEMFLLVIKCLLKFLSFSKAFLRFLK